MVKNTKITQRFFRSVSGTGTGRCRGLPVPAPAPTGTDTGTGTNRHRHRHQPAPTGPVRSGPVCAGRCRSVPVGAGLGGRCRLVPVPLTDRKKRCEINLVFNFKKISFLFLFFYIFSFPRLKY
jgi:hypothetical protein